MASKTMNKWEDYVAEIKPELYRKLNDYVAIDNFGDSKKTKAFRLSKNGENTNKPDNSGTTDNGGDTGESGDIGGGNVQ